MNFKFLTRLSAASLIVSAGLATAASAASVQITISNNSSEGGLYYTPFLNVFHDGSYSAFTEGQAASSSLETLAELGGVAEEAANAESQGALTFTLADPAGFGSAPGQPPVFDPGNSNSFTLNLDPTANQYLTVLSMAIPSNDTFISSTIQLFDDAGQFIATDYILGASSVYDAGTEVNQTFGQAFNPADGNGPGGLGDDENGVVHSSSIAEFATLFGQPIPTGGTTSSNGVDLNNLVSIEVSQVPLPAGAPLLLAGLGAFAWMRRRKTA
jgi:hypothetical protein